MRLTLLHNPTAGEEDHDREGLESLLSEAGHDVRYRSLKDDDWTEVLDDTVDLIVVAGGDGSARKLFTAIGRSPTVAQVLPLGSANNIARTLGLDSARAVAILAHGQPSTRRAFDLWDVESTWGRSRCVEALGGGLFAEVLADAEDVDADPSGSDNVDFGLELLGSTLTDAEPRTWALEIDGSRLEEELIGVEAMNIREIGANLPFAPDADPGDGLLDLVLIGADDRDALAGYVAARLRDEDVPPPRLPTRRGREVVLEPPSEVRMHVDDLLPAWDLSTTRWIRISAAEVRLELVVPLDESGGPS
jgi:diacylglycerol kinase (ATP)